MSNELSAIVITPDQRKLIQTTIAPGATQDELALFLYDNQRRGVHPLDKMIHFTKRGGKYVPVTSIDFMRSRASATGQYAGSDDAVFDDDSNPTRATITVYRLVGGVRCPFTSTARMSEYRPASGQDHMWRKMPCTMLGKCAEALSLRKAFPQELDKLYTREEMDQAGEEPVVVVDPITTTNNQSETDKEFYSIATNPVALGPESVERSDTIASIVTAMGILKKTDADLKKWLKKAGATSLDDLEMTKLGLMAQWLSGLVDKKTQEGGK